LQENDLRPGSNVYADLGAVWKILMRDPDQAAHSSASCCCILGEDRVLWGTDSIWFGSPQDQIEAFRAFEITPQLRERHGYPALTREAKRKILGLNAARVYGVNPNEIPKKLSSGRPRPRPRGMARRGSGPDSGARASQPARDARALARAPAGGPRTMTTVSRRSDPADPGCSRRLGGAQNASMHELSISQGIVESVCDAVPDGRVLAVTVEIGKLSGVVPDAVRFCFDECAGAHGSREPAGHRRRARPRPLLQLRAGARHGGADHLLPVRESPLEILTGRSCGSGAWR
jgi:hypothetical protein